jgi:hypothetical protein
LYRFDTHDDPFYSYPQLGVARRARFIGGKSGRSVGVAVANRSNAITKKLMPPKIVGLSQLAGNALHLPRLPVPPLPATLGRYTASVRALKKESTVARHLAVLAKFVDSGSAAATQKLLVDRDAADASRDAYPHSYIERLWDDAYLNFRGPSPINIAPAFTMKSFKGTPAMEGAGGLAGQPVLAGKFVRGAVRWAHKLLGDALDTAEPPLCVAQLAVQFGFSRLPHSKRDTLFRADLAESLKRVTVLHKGYIFLVNLKCPTTDDFYDEATLARAFAGIVAGLEGAPPNPSPVTCLTGASRGDWDASRKLLQAHSVVNAGHIGDIDASFAVVCLDATVWGDDMDRLHAGMLVGTDGTKATADDRVNRWYEKHQLIFDAADGGRVAGNFEHAFSDGLSWCRWIGEVHASMLGGTAAGFTPLPAISAKSLSDAAPIVRRLDFDLGEPAGAIAAAIRTAQQQLSKLAGGVELGHVALPVGKTAIKKLGVAPDAFCQMVYHLAYYRVHGKIAPTYESCSTARFYHGRTETIRTATLPMYELVSHKALSSWNVAAALDSSETCQALREVIARVGAAQAALTRDAGNGLGVDRHLLALKSIVMEEQDAAGLAFFNEHLFEFSGTWQLSTSNVTQPFMDHFNFGPVAPDGYGIGYNIQPGVVHASVSSFDSSASSDNNGMAAAMLAAADELGRILAKK